MATRDVEHGPNADHLHSGRRTLAVLEALAARPHGATPKELSQALGLHLSTCYRLLNTLVAGGYAVRDPGNGLFRLGRRVAYLNDGYVAALRPPSEILAFLHALQVATGETAMLFQLEGDDAIPTAIVRGNLPGALAFGYVGVAAPAHATATGRALLAWLPAAQREAYLARCTSAPTSPWFPPANPDALRGEFEQIRIAGYAVDRGAGNPDVWCVAAPVSDGGSAVEAIGVVAPSARLRREEAATVAVILEIARAISALQASLSLRDVQATSSEDDNVPTQASIESALATIAADMSRVG
jgi:IclR family transcriptional regulator, acetate operon repressor